MRTREAEAHLQGVWRQQHMRAREAEAQMQGVRGCRHLCTREAEVQMLPVLRQCYCSGLVWPDLAAI